MTAARPRSLQARMLVLSAIATLTALAVAGWVIAGVLERFVTAGLDRRLDAEVALLASTVDPAGRIDRERLRERIGALEGGSGWHWRIAAPGETVGSADFVPPAAGPVPPDADRHPHHATPAEDRIRPLDSHDGEHGGQHARQLTLVTGAGPVVLTAAAPRDVVRRPIRDALVPLLSALAALAVMLAGATLVQLRVGLRPLRRLRDQVAAIRAGRIARVDEDQPAELRPLAVELNSLAADNAAALAAARLASANLAHALKTQIATLALDLAGDPARAAQIARIDATIRHHLGRARAGAVDRRAATPLAPAIAALVDAIRRLHRDRAVAVEVADDLTVAVDPHDLDEMIGNLLDNAARHARRTVRLTAARDATDPRLVRVAIADDGAGIPAAARALAAQPGARLDERGGGHGFGLSIATELVQLYGGRLTLDDAAGGGLLVAITLPVAG